MYTREEITLATYLFWYQNIDDPNIVLTSEQIEAMYAEARKFMPTVPDLIGRLRASDATIAADIMVHFYDVGKQYFGEEKQQLFRFFALLYLVIWGKSAGPRFGEFAALYGRENFADLIEEKFAVARTWI